MVPCGYSSGTRGWRGAITKAGNVHVRRVIGEPTRYYLSWCHPQDAILTSLVKSGRMVLEADGRLKERPPGASRAACNLPY
ncbi:MAG: IS110 family transposase [Acetobacteraceae bacterium]|nr:IS110 family transposase [Acetobacteraceae bacterium]